MIPLRLDTILVVAVLIFSPQLLNAQFEPPVGQEGTTAIYADSAIFVNWASNCVVERGMVDISNPELGLSTYGSDSVAIGKADNSVVSLGDGGTAVSYFEVPIVNGPGYDFAIFENSFLDDFLELAFVEVSSDGINFVRFENTSNTSVNEQVATFGTIDATKVNNLAGKYRGGYGCPFDLAELENISGLDIYNITSIKIIDVIGSIDTEYASYDSHENIVNDPWPTPFESSGFDLDAIGVINDKNHTDISENNISVKYTAGPNPFKDYLKIYGFDNDTQIDIYDLSGRRVLSTFTKEQYITIEGSSLPKGLLFIHIRDNTRFYSLKIIHN